jgi:hypothetical protein
MVTQEAYGELLKRYEALEAKYEQMLPYMSYLQRMMFGARSERRLDPVNPLQESLFAPPEPLEPVVVPTETITYERTKKSPGSHPAASRWPSIFPGRSSKSSIRRRTLPPWSASANRSASSWPCAPYSST